QEQLSRIARDEEHNEAFQQALRYVAVKSRSTKEVERRLKEKEYEADAIAAAIEKLTTLQFLDDRHYAQRLTEHRLHSQKKGRRWIVHELKEKGMDDDTIQHALQQIDEEAEYEAAYAIALKRWKPEQDDEQAQRRKVGAFLQRRGFSL